MQSARDHQVQDEPQVVFQADDDALADAPNRTDGAALQVLERRLDSSKQKWTGEPDTLEGLAKDPRFESEDVGGDVREFRHEQ